jgi:hypothetical protein
VSVSTTRYRHGMPYYPEAEPFFDPFDAVARTRSSSPPVSALPQTRSRATPSPPTLHFPSIPPPGPTSLHSSNDTGNAASPNSSSSSSERNLDLRDTAEPGLTDGDNWAAPIWSQAEWDEATPSPPDENIVPQCQNLNSHGTHSVPAQVIAQLYSSHFSSRENVAAESQEIAELYNRHFPDEWYSMPENAVTNTVALTADTVAGTANTVAATDDTAAATDDTVADSNNGNASNFSFEHHDDDEAYDATYDDRNWQELQREADTETQQQHYYTRQHQSRPDWGIQDPGWQAPRAPTAHPDAKPPSNHRLTLFTVSLLPQETRSDTTHRSCLGHLNISSTADHFPSDYMSCINCVTFCLRRKRRRLLGDGWIRYASHFPFLSATRQTSRARQKGTMNLWSIWTMRKACVQHETANIDHIFSCTGTAHAVHVQLTWQIRHIAIPRYSRCLHSFPNLSVVVCSTASQYNVLPKNFNQYLCISPPLNVGLIIATSLFSFLFSPLASSATSRSRSWTPFSTLVDNPSEDPWAGVDYFYFFLSSPCKMGGKATKPKTVMVIETSGFKEED